MPTLATRKRDLHERLTEHHVDGGFMPAEEHYDEQAYDPVSPNQAAKRMFALIAVSMAAYDFDQSEKLMEWLKKENLWASVTENEKLFFRDPSPSDQLKQELSWRFEAAYIFAWALQKVEALPAPSSELKEKEVRDFLTNVPGPGRSTAAVLNIAAFRNITEIVDEKLFYQSAMMRLNYQRDNHLENSISVQPMAAFERYAALLFILGGNSTSWDELTMVEEDDVT